MNKISKKLLAFLAICTAVTPVLAQEVAEDSTLVNVAFRKVAKEDIMGGVSTVNIAELMEKNYNTYSLDNMQGYVSGFNGAGMWGQTGQLVLIDGVPREANNVKPDEIESITFLKGAQAVVLYGSKAANGAILITTKRGKVTEGLSVNVRANTGWAVAKAYPEYLGSAEYMTLFNEAVINDGPYAKEQLIAPELIAKYASGANPYRYPDVEFYSDEFIKKAYNRTDVTAEIEGGNDRAKFYANVSYYRQGDLFKFGEAKNNYIDRFNVRGNVDIKLNQFISAYVNANATYYNSKSANGGSYWEAAATLRPNRVAPLIPLSYIDPNAAQPNSLISTTKNFINGCFLGGTQLDLSNIFADYYFAGDNTWTSRQFQFDAGVDVDLSSVAKGLSFHTMVGVDYRTSYTTAFNNSYATFTPTWSEYNGQDVIIGLNNYETVDKHSGVQNISGSTDNQTIAFNAHFDYVRTFGDVHNVNAMLVANGYQQSESAVYHKVSNANLGLQLGYNYDRKYYAELALAAPWSAKLPEGKRAGFSPSVTLGWNIAREDFMEDGLFNDLVLSASYSDLVTDLGIDEYYMYLGAYQSGGWWDWNGMSGHAGVQSKRGANDDLSYIHRKELSVNLRGSMFDRALTFDASFFTTKTTGQIITASNQMPSYFKVDYPGSSFRPYINYNDDKRTGFDIAVNYKKQLGDFGFQIGANYTYYTTKATKRDDTNFADKYQYRQGKPVDAIWGYECLGFFKDEADIQASPTQKWFAQDVIAPGDLKYKDQNGDNVIDDKDQVELAKGGWYGSPSTVGVNLTLKYKNFTLFMLGVGGFGGHGVRNNSYWWVKGDDKYSAAVRDRWTPETAKTAKYPRLTTGNGNNNYQTSDFWLYSTSRFDLAKVQLTYDFPKSLFGKSFVKGASIYVSGNSLLTIAKEREILEMSIGSAPQTRFYNLGVQVAF